MHNSAKAGELGERWLQPQFSRGENHDRHGEQGVDEPAQVHLPQRDDETGVDGQQQQKIHLARADQLGQIRAVHEEERLIHLLDKIARTDQQHHLPLRPGADGIGLREYDADEAQLQPEPEQFHDDP